jgi:ABC-type transport system involved in multi-copper enzyme maturation permease subunit
VDEVAHTAFGVGDDGDLGPRRRVAGGARRERERPRLGRDVRRGIGVLFGALVLGALGVRTMSSEYSTGMIRTTASAIPRRTRFLWSKVVVVAGTTFVVALLANVTGFTIGQAVLRGEGIDVSITADGSIEAIVAGAIAVSAFAVVGVGLATIVKRATIANILMALVVIGGQLVGTAMPTSAQRFLPFNALQASVSVKRSDELLSQGVALGFIVGYAVVTVVVGAGLLQRRDV